MPEKKRYNIKKMLSTALWLLFGAATMVLLGAAIRKKDTNRCTSVEVTIEGVENNFFIDKTDVFQLLEKSGFVNLRQRPLNTFDLAGMESILEKNVWIKSAELYFDNNDILKINILEREPVVRVFTSSGASFYIDSSLKKLPLNTKFSARLPVFTNFPVFPNTSLKNENKVLQEVKNLGMYILNDPFWMAQIEQIEITARHTFEMIPKIGNQVIIFGPADNYAEKFNNLLMFYKKVQSRVGWNKYAAINVSYKDQIIAVKREAGDIQLDSLRTERLVKLLIANAQKQANESANTIQLEQPAENNSFSFLQGYTENFMDKQVSINDTLTGERVTSEAAKLTPEAAPDEDGKLNTNIKTASDARPYPVRIKKSALKSSNKKSEAHPATRTNGVNAPDNDY